MKIIFYKYWLRRLWYWHVVALFRPRNRWLTKWVPRTWRDTDYLIEQALFRGLIFFWEEDGGEACLRAQWDRELYKGESLDRRLEYKDAYELLLSAYEWAKQEVGIYERKPWQEEWVSGLSHEQSMQQSTLHLTNIIKLRGYMWT